MTRREKEDRILSALEDIRQLSDIIIDILYVILCG